MSNEQVILSSKTDSAASITEQGFTIQTQDGQQITRGTGETWQLLEWL